MSVQDREVPGQPGQAAAQQGQTEVVVHRHPPTPRTGPSIFFRKREVRKIKILGGGEILERIRICWKNSLKHPNFNPNFAILGGL